MRAIVYHREGERDEEDGSTGRQGTMRVRFLLFGVQASYLKALRDTFGREGRLLLADASDAGTQADHDAGTGGKVKKAGDSTHYSLLRFTRVKSLRPAHRFAYSLHPFAISLTISPRECRIDAAATIL
jgi:hypothetical protein